MLRMRDAEAAQKAQASAGAAGDGGNAGTGDPFSWRTWLLNEGAAGASGTVGAWDSPDWTSPLAMAMGAGKVAAPAPSVDPVVQGDGQGYGLAPLRQDTRGGANGASESRGSVGDAVSQMSGASGLARLSPDTVDMLQRFTPTFAYPANSDPGGKLFQAPLFSTGYHVPTMPTGSAAADDGVPANSPKPSSPVSPMVTASVPTMVRAGDSSTADNSTRGNNGDDYNGKAVAGMQSVPALLRFADELSRNGFRHPGYNSVDPSLANSQALLYEATGGDEKSGFRILRATPGSAGPPVRVETYGDNGEALFLHNFPAWRSDPNASAFLTHVSSSGAASTLAASAANASRNALGEYGYTSTFDPQKFVEGSPVYAGQGSQQLRGTGASPLPIRATPSSQASGDLSSFGFVPKADAASFFREAMPNLDNGASMALPQGDRSTLGQAGVSSPTPDPFPFRDNDNVVGYGLPLLSGEPAGISASPVTQAQIQDYLNRYIYVKEPNNIPNSRLNTMLNKMPPYAWRGYVADLSPVGQAALLHEAPQMQQALRDASARGDQAAAASYAPYAKMCADTEFKPQDSFWTKMLKSFAAGELAQSGPVITPEMASSGLDHLNRQGTRLYTGNDTASSPPGPIFAPDVYADNVQRHDYGSRVISNVLGLGLPSNVALTAATLPIGGAGVTGKLMLGASLLSSGQQIYQDVKAGHPQEALADATTGVALPLALHAMWKSAEIPTEGYLPNGQKVRVIGTMSGQDGPQMALDVEGQRWIAPKAQAVAVMRGLSRKPIKPAPVDASTLKWVGTNASDAANGVNGTTGSFVPTIGGQAGELLAGGMGSTESRGTTGARWYYDGSKFIVVPAKKPLHDEVGNNVDANEHGNQHYTIGESEGWASKALGRNMKVHEVNKAEELLRKRGGARYAISNMKVASK